MTRSFGQRFRSSDPLAEAIKRLEPEDLRFAIDQCPFDLEISVADDFVLRCYQPVGIDKLSTAELRELAANVFAAESDEDLDAILSGHWSKFFERDKDVPLFGKDDNEDDWDDESEETLEADAPPWHDVLVIRSGRGVTLPPGLEYRERPLLAHQERSVESLRRWWRSPSRAGVLCLPTGSGKTRTAVAFALGEAVRSGRRVLWLAHRSELVDQAIAAFAEAGATEQPFSVARFEAGNRKYNEPSNVVVASLPTLAWQSDGSHPNLDALRDIHDSFDLVIVDECHHAVAPTWKGVISRLSARRKLLGLSATPTRTSERERAALWRQLGDVIHEEPVLELVKAGVLARPNVTIVSTGRTFDADETERREFRHFKDLPVRLVKRIATDAKRNSLVARTYLDGRARWKQTLVFAATIDQASALQNQLRSAGVRCAELFASADRAERNAVVRAFRAREIDVLVNVMLFSEGTDLPAVDTVFIARPTLSDILFRQMVGRGMRGPLFGGTAECNVVAFHDDVRGLVDGMLGSTFGEQRDALSALGLGDPTNAIPAARPTDTKPSSSTQRERLQQLSAKLAALPRGALPRDALAGVSLEGWWEVRSTTERRFLPVMIDDRDILAGFVDDLKAHLRQGTSPRLTNGTAWVQTERLTEFATFALRARTEPLWNPIANATVEEVRDVLAALTQAVDAASVHATPRRDWFGIARALEAARDAGDELFDVDGNLIAIRAGQGSAIARLWDSLSEDLRENATPEEVHLFARMACRSLAPEFNRAVAEKLFVAAARTRAFPNRLDAKEIDPPLPEIATELAGIPSAERRDRVAMLHRSFFASRFPDREAFLLALLESQFE